MERIKIKVNQREGKGKEIVKKMRKQGDLPAVIYGHGVNAVLNVPTPSLKLLKSIHFSESAILDMEIVGDSKNKSIPVLIKDVQFHPITDEVIHIDFLKVSLKEKIKVHIPIILIGEAKGIKEDGGIQEQILREIEVEGLPLDMPENIELDISELTIGKSIHVEELKVAGNLKIMTDPKTTIVTAVLKKEEEEPSVEEALVEGGAPTEPEVIKEKKDRDSSASEEKQEKPEKPEKPEKQKK